MLIFHVIAAYCLLMSQLHMKSSLCPQPTTTQDESTGTENPKHGGINTVSPRPSPNEDVGCTEGNGRDNSQTVGPTNDDDNHGPPPSKPEDVGRPEGNGRDNSQTVDPPPRAPARTVSENACRIDQDCLKNYFCVNDNGNSECQCQLPYVKDSSGRCLKSCVNDYGCTSSERCSSGFCECPNNHIWSTELHACVKDCSYSPSVCRIDAESCQPVRGHLECQCSAEYLYSFVYGACMKRCEDDENCNTEKEKCTRVDNDRVCWCNWNGGWMTVNGECVPREN